MSRSRAAVLLLAGSVLSALVALPLIAAAAPWVTVAEHRPLAVAEADRSADAHLALRAARESAAVVAQREAEAAAAAEAAALAAREAEVRAAQERADRARRDPRSLARSLAADRGWGADQFGCLDRLWTKESDWRWNADNPTSSAYGIPQALPGSKMASAGDDWETNPATQVAWGLGYIAEAYGTPCAAWAHSQARNWY